MQLPDQKNVAGNADFRQNDLLLQNSLNYSKVTSYGTNSSVSKYLQYAHLQQIKKQS